MYNLARFCCFLLMNAVRILRLPATVIYLLDSFIFFVNPRIMTCVLKQDDISGNNSFFIFFV